MAAKFFPTEIHVYTMIKCITNMGQYNKSNQEKSDISVIIPSQIPIVTWWLCWQSLTGKYCNYGCVVFYYRNVPQGFKQAYLKIIISTSFYLPNIEEKLCLETWGQKGQKDQFCNPPISALVLLLLGGTHCMANHIKGRTA